MYPQLNQLPNRNRPNGPRNGYPGPSSNEYSPRGNGYSVDKPNHSSGYGNNGRNNPYAGHPGNQMSHGNGVSPYGNMAQPNRFNSIDRVESPMESLGTIETARTSYSASNASISATANKSRRTVAEQVIRDVYSKIVVVDGKRVLDTCYQTHVLIQEFSHYPSEAPPANATPNQIGSVKNRILVICAKHTGRVLIQKGKLNEQKNIYQIGRTWDLDELKCISRVGPDGILLFINKDYYWKISEGVERTVRFIKALSSYYGLFVGRYPQMKGITLEELNLPAQPRKVQYGGSSNASSTNDIVLNEHAADPQLMKSKSLKSKNLPNPILPPPATQQPKEYYKDFDFTSNGQLPMKPMKVIERGTTDADSELNFNVDPDKTEYSELPTEDSFNFGTPEAEENLNAPDDSEINREVEQNRILNQSDTSDKFHTPLHLRQNSKTAFSHSRGPSDSIISPRKNSARVDTIKASESQRNSKISLEEQIVEEFSRSIPEAPKASPGPFSLDFGIEEITDESDIEEDKQTQRARNNKNIPDERKIPQKSEIPHDELSKRESIINTDPLDTSIQEIENLLDSQFAYNKNESRNMEKQVSQREKRMSNNDSLENTTGYSLEEDESIFSKTAETGLNIKKTEASEPLVAQIEVDPEVEELLDEVNWSMTDTGNSLIKKLAKELHGVKGKNVEELLSLDFSNNVVANEFGTSISEVDNLSYIFKKMEVDFKLLSAEVDSTEDNSKGLQVKFLNKQKLHSTLQGILEKVSINSNDLAVIANFQDFDRWKNLPQLESNLFDLYNALSTIRNDVDDSTRGLSSMNALKQYQRTYEEVTNQFIHNFNGFIISQLRSLLDQLSSSLDNFSTHFMLRELNNLLIYSGITYFVKYVDPASFREMNQQFNGEISNLLEKLLNVKLKHIQASNMANATSLNSILSHSLDNGSGLKKSRTLRLTRKDKLRKVDEKPSFEVESLKRKPNEIEDPMVVNNFAEEAKDLISIVQYFVVTFFHYDSNTLDFDLYLQENSFEDRRKFIDKVPNLEISELNIGKSYSTNDLINNMTTIFGNFINLFMKKVNPVDYRIPQVLIYMEDLLNKAQNQRANQEFLIFNFLKKTVDKFKGNWKKFIAANIESINKSLIVANSGILLSVRNINEIILATERATTSRIAQETDVPQLIDESYNDITEALVHLFMRDDPLLKNHEFDDKERVHRNVSILQNLFYLIDLLKSVNSPATMKIITRLDAVFNKVRDMYFQKQINKSISKLVEFVDNYDTLEKMGNGKTKKFNKKHVKSLLAGYNPKDISQKVHEIRRKFEKHFITGEDMFEQDLLNKLWIDMEAAYNDYFQRLNVIIRKEFGNEIEYSMSKQEIHSIFRSVH